MMPIKYRLYDDSTGYFLPNSHNTHHFQTMYMSAKKTRKDSPRIIKKIETQLPASHSNLTIYGEAESSNAKGTAAIEKNGGQVLKYPHVISLPK